MPNETAKLWSLPLSGIAEINVKASQPFPKGTRGPGSLSCWLADAMRARGYHFSLIPSNSSVFHAACSLLIQPREDLPDGPKVIRRVSGRGESGGSTQVVPIRAGGDDLSPFFGFVAEAVA